MSLRDFLTMGKRGMIYLQAIDDFLLKRQREAITDKKKKGVHPSGISHPCLKSLYYSFHRMPRKPKDPRIIKILDNGTSMHERYNHYAQEAGILIAKDMRLIHEEYRVRSYLDQLVLIDNKLLIIELKSMNNDKFNKLMGRPLDAHRQQLQMYMWLINELFINKNYLEEDKWIFDKYKDYFPITKSIIVVENKNNQFVEEFSIKYDEELMQSILKTIKKLFSYVDNNKLPQRGFDKDSQECRWCDYNKICWGDDIMENLRKKEKERIDKKDEL